MDKNYLKIAGNIHLSYFVEAADILGIEYEIVIPSLTAKFSHNGRHWFINNTVTPLTNSPSSKLARTKHFANMILEKAGIPVPKQQKLTKEIEAIAFFGKYREIVLKPSQNIGGKGVSILPKNEDEVLESFKYAQNNDKHGKLVLGEQYIAGDNYRVLVVGDKVVSVIKRVPAHVIADGVNTIDQLIGMQNAVRKEKLLKPISIDLELEHKLASQDFKLSSIPPKDTTVLLRSNANMTTGGTTEEVSEIVDQSYKDICVNAIKALDLEYGGVDLITPDISKPEKCAVNEINFNPGLRIHYKVDKGTPQKVAVDIMRYIMEKYSR